MKRCFLIFVLLVLCLVGCNRTPDEPELPPQEETEISSPEELVKLEEVVSIVPATLDEKYKAIAYDMMFRVGELNIHAQLVFPVTYAEKPCPIALYLPDVRTDIADLATRFASKGIIVAKLTTRGSSGLSEGTKDIGGDDLADLEQLFSVLSKATFLSASDFVLVGASEGTVRCLQLAAKGHARIAACVLTGTMSDLAVLHAGAAKAFFEAYLGGTPESVPQAYASRSAVTFADMIKIPVLMIYSKGLEANFPISQPRALEEALLAAGNDKSMLIEVEGAFTDFQNNQALQLVWAWINEYT